ncbi:hypothetical protein B0J14DRAFT_601730 [Halenospora varia]|nr:hypothetical protein B0J14DRAFT_601730 [Halenospora varia]
MLSPIALLASLLIIPAALATPLPHTEAATEAASVFERETTPARWGVAFMTSVNCGKGGKMPAAYGDSVSDEKCVNIGTSTEPIISAKGSGFLGKQGGWVIEVYPMKDCKQKTNFFAKMGEQAQVIRLNDGCASQQIMTKDQREWKSFKVMKID